MVIGKESGIGWRRKVNELEKTEVNGSNELEKAAKVQISHSSNGNARGRFMERVAVRKNGLRQFHYSILPE
jgi:hypothetical protein